MKTDIFDALGELILKSLTRILVILLLPLLLIYLIYRKVSLSELKTVIRECTLGFSKWWDLFMGANKSEGGII